MDLTAHKDFDAFKSDKGWTLQLVTFDMQHKEEVRKASIVFLPLSRVWYSKDLK